jgi:hypothetical protein
MEDTREGVATELVGAGEMREARALEPGAHVEGVRIVRSKPGCEERADEEQRDEEKPREAERVGEQPAQAGEAPGRLKGERGHAGRARR